MEFQSVVCGLAWLEMAETRVGVCSTDGELKHTSEMYGRSCVLSVPRAQPSVPFCRTGGFAALVFIAQSIPTELSALCSQLLDVALCCFQPSGGASLCRSHLKPKGLLREGGSRLQGGHFPQTIYWETNESVLSYAFLVINVSGGGRSPQRAGKERWILELRKCLRDLFTGKPHQLIQKRAPSPPFCVCFMGSFSIPCSLWAERCHRGWFSFPLLVWLHRKHLVQCHSLPVPTERFAKSIQMHGAVSPADGGWVWGCILMGNGGIQSSLTWRHGISKVGKGY